MPVSGPSYHFRGRQPRPLVLPAPAQPSPSQRPRPPTPNEDPPISTFAPRSFLSPSLLSTIAQHLHRSTRPSNDTSSPHRTSNSLHCCCHFCAPRRRCRCRSAVLVNFKHRACSLSHSLSVHQLLRPQPPSASHPPTGTRSLSNNSFFTSRNCISDTIWFPRFIHSDIPPYPAVQTFGNPLKENPSFQLRLYHDSHYNLPRTRRSIEQLRSSPTTVQSIILLANQYGILRVEFVFQYLLK